MFILTIVVSPTRQTKQQAVQQHAVVRTDTASKVTFWRPKNTHGPHQQRVAEANLHRRPHRLCPHSLSHRSSSSTAAPAPRGHHKPERIGHYELLPRRLGNPTTGACPCRSARTRATPAAAAPARQRASKRHAGWLSRVWAVLRGTVRRGTQPRPHTHTHAHSYQPVCIRNTYYLTYPSPHTRDARLGRR